MIRETSIEAYTKLRSSKLLNGKQLQIAEMVMRYGPATANELYLRAEANQTTPRSLLVQQNIHARLNELREMDVVMEVGKRRCIVTGRAAITWKATYHLPTKVICKPDKLDQQADKISREFHEFIQSIDVPYVYQQRLEAWIYNKVKIMFC